MSVLVELLYIMKQFVKCHCHGINDLFPDKAVILWDGSTKFWLQMCQVIKENTLICRKSLTSCWQGKHIDSPPQCLFNLFSPYVLAFWWTFSHLMCWRLPVNINKCYSRRELRSNADIWCVKMLPLGTTSLSLKLVSYCRKYKIQVALIKCNALLEILASISCYITVRT